MCYTLTIPVQLLSPLRKVGNLQKREILPNNISKKGFCLNVWLPIYYIAVHNKLIISAVS